MPGQQALNAQGIYVWKFSRAHFEARQVEWLFSAVMAFMGVLLALQPSTFAENPSFAGWASLMGQGRWALLLIGVGTVRLAALAINGAWRRSPYLRAAGAAVGLIVWGLLLYSVLRLTIPSLGVAIYAPFLAFEFLALRIAMREAGAAEKAVRDAR